MQIVKQKTKFPCGYEVEEELKLKGFSIWWMKKIKKCPLHGKDCKPMEELG